MSDTLEVVLRHKVEAVPVAGDFEVVSRPARNPGDGELLVRPVYQSLDPYIGSRLRSRHMGETAPAPGESLPGFSVAEVLASKFDGIAAGEYVVGECGWAQRGIMKGAGARKVDPSLPLSAHLGLLGMPGLTAWAGVTQLAQVGPGDVFLVDAAAGSVGGTAGQIARHLGAKSFGIAGGAEKCAFVVDKYRFDGCIDYRQENWIDKLAELPDGGPSVHFENVGTSVLVPVLRKLKLYGRIVLCGLAEHYHSDGPAPEMPVGTIVGKRAKILGLVVYDYYARLDEWVTMARPWIEAGTIASGEDIADGIDGAALQFERLMQGKNQGKSLVRIGPDKA